MTIILDSHLALQIHETVSNIRTWGWGSANCCEFITVMRDGLRRSSTHDVTCGISEPSM